MSPHTSRITYLALLWTRILGTPFWGLVSMLTFILYKNLHITPLQITAIVALKPMSSLIAPYWSQAIYKRPDQIVANLVWANLFRYLPFLFIPWITSPWYIIFAFGFYMMLHRAVIPAWMEILRHNLPETNREKAIATGSTIDFCGTALITLVLGILLDSFENIWQWLFFTMAILGLASTWILCKIPPPAVCGISDDRFMARFKFSFSRKTFHPWKQCWQLLKERPDFAAFQIGFMLGGSGLMILQPALPIFFVETLKMSFIELSLALAMCKGIGVALSSSYWTKLFRRINIYTFTSLVTFLAALFPLCLLIAPLHISLIYVAYVLYGVMQAGSEMSWHMSGLIFAKEKESSLFSSANVLSVGIRGCIIPALGALILPYTNSIGIMLMGVLFCLFASLHLIRFKGAIDKPAKAESALS